MYLTRYLHFRKTPLALQRILTLVAALLGVLLLLRLSAYGDHSWNDWSWMGHLIWEIANAMQRISPPLVILAAGLYLWYRGIVLGQRDLGFDSVGFSFRVGIIAFLWLFLLQIVIPAPRQPRIALFYFLLGLIAVGLSRIESVSQSRMGVRSPFDASWMGILGSATLALLGVSALVASLLTWRDLSRVALILQPVWILLGRLAAPLGVAVAWLLEGLLNALIRLFSGLFGELGTEMGFLTDLSVRLEQFQQSQPAQGAAQLVLQVLKWGFYALVMVSVLAVIAFSVNRLRRVQEDNSEVPTAVWESGRPEAQPDGTPGVWQHLWDALQAQWAQLKGEDYSLLSIRRIYASLQRLAAASGYPRPEAATPYEYMAILGKGFEGSEGEIHLITEAYVRAHYGQRIFAPEYVQRVRDAWLALRAQQEQRSNPTRSD
jgi:hypothetical protein